MFRKKINKELEEIKRLLVAQPNKIVQVNKPIQTICAEFVANEEEHIPTEYIKRELANKISQTIIDNMELDFNNNGVWNQMVYSARIGIVIR